MTDIRDIDLNEWMKERNILSADNGVKINRVMPIDHGKYELEIAVDNLNIVKALEDGYSKYTEYTKSSDDKLASPSSAKEGRKLIRENHAVASVKYKDLLTRPDLDILGGFDPFRSNPQEIYKRSIDYYQSKGIYGTSVNVLCNFACKGFSNDIDDLEIKNFYDTWCYTVGFDKLVRRIFLDLIRVGVVYPYKVVGRYIPSLNYITPVSKDKSVASMDLTPSTVLSNISSIYKEFGYIYGKTSKDTLDKIDSTIESYLSKLPREHAARKIKWAKDFIPVGYTILNPTLVDVKGSLLFGGQILTLKADETIKKYFELEDSLLSDEQKRLRRLLPSDFRNAIQDGSEIVLNPDLVGQICYNKQDYERYSMPRGLRAFDSMLLKDALNMADMSTIDGITNYIMKVTVGNDNHPMTDLSQLDALADIFNTAQKAFTVFWNHTLDIEKIVLPEAGAILGPAKYEQVEKDITGALGMVRGLIDGTSTSGSNPASIELSVKSVIEEVNYLRSEVESWIYSEYKAIAEGMGFDKFPMVRFDNNALKDELKMMSMVQGMIDRRIISYQSGIEMLGMDPNTIFSQLKAEKQSVIDGDFGVIGSPYNPKLTPMGSAAPTPNNPTPGNKNVQPKQRTPTGTPSEGRPKTGGMGTPKKAVASLSIEVSDIDEDQSMMGIVTKDVFVLSKKDDNFVEKPLNSYLMFSANASYDLNRFQAESLNTAVKRAQSQSLLDDDVILLFKGTGTVGRNTFFELVKKVRVISDGGEDGGESDE